MKIDPSQYDNIIDMYECQNMSTTKISKIYNVNRITISRILKYCGVVVGRYITTNNKIIDIVNEETQKNIIKQYKIKTITELIHIFNLSRSQIIKILRYNNICIRSNSIETKKYKIREEFFDNIDNEISAYFLGLLFADGCNTGHNIKITLNEDDKDILEIFSKSLFLNERPLYFIERNEKETYKNQYSLVICDHHITKRLNEIGIVPKKSLICMGPNVLFTRDTFRHFLRGFFDGDGAVFLVKTGYIRMAFIGTFDFLTFLTDMIDKYLDIKSNKLYQDISTKKMFHLKYGKKSEIEKLYNFMYNDATIYIKRKQKILENFYDYTS